MRGCVLVTGASSGIGEATALRLAAAGFLVAAGVRRTADAERLQARAGERLRGLLLDVTDEQQVTTALAEVARWTDGRLSGVVNNAGVVVGGPLEFLALDDWRHQFEVNVVGAVSVTRAALPLLRAGGGRVVMMGSNSGRIAVGMMGPYCASKHALEAVAESLRLELRPSGIAVVLLEPGAVRTPIWAKGRATADRMRRELPAQAHRLYGDQIEAIVAGIDAQEASGIEPEVVADAVLDALTGRRPRPRRAVGADAVVSALVDRWLPDRSRAPLIARLSRP